MSFEDYFTSIQLIGLVIIIFSWIARFFHILFNNNIRIIKIYQIISIFILPILPVIYYAVLLIVKLIKWESKGSVKRLRLFYNVNKKFIKFLFTRSN
jgi:hypothetical protein